MRVTFFQRRPGVGQVSMEQLFEQVRAALPGHIEGRVAECRFASKGLVGRLYNLVEAAARQGDVNHVTGDVHFLALGLDPRRTLLTVHDFVHKFHPNPFKRWLLNLLWLRWPVRRAGMVSAISEATRQEVIAGSGCAPEHVRVIPDCVGDDIQFVPKSFDDATPEILQIGARWNKNVPRLLAALQGIRCHLRIVGYPDEPTRAALAASTVPVTCERDLSRAEIVRRYQECDIVTFPSLYEGFGLPIVEAQAAGRPVVTSRRAPMTEVAGDGACFVDPLDPADIRAGILRVRDDPDYRNDLIRKGLHNVERFRPDRVAALYAAAYEDLYRSASRRGLWRRVRQAAMERAS